MIRTPSLLCAVLLVAVGCGPATPAALLDGESDDDAAADDLVERCGFAAVPFDPHGGTIVQAISADGATCARVDREPLAVRRGTDWRAIRFRASTAAASFDATDTAALGYLATHHNCMDEASATIDGALHGLVIDGASVDPDVCFADDADAWRIVLRVAGVEHVLVPWSPPP